MNRVFLSIVAATAKTGTGNSAIDQKLPSLFLNEVCNARRLSSKFILLGGTRGLLYSLNHVVFVQIMKTKITTKGIAAKGDSATLIPETPAPELPFPDARKYLLVVAPAPRRWCFLIVIAFLSMVFANQTHAQQNKDFLLSKNQFRIGAGATFVATRDFLYSPIMYKSVRTNVQLGYSNRREKSIFFTDPRCVYGFLKT